MSDRTLRNEWEIRCWIAMYAAVPPNVYDGVQAVRIADEAVLELRNRMPEFLMRVPMGERSRVLPIDDADDV